MEVNKVTDGWDREMNKFERYQRNGRDGTASVTECWLGMKSCWAKSRMASRFLTVSGQSLKKERHGRCLRKTEQSKELQVGQSELT